MKQVGNLYCICNTNFSTDLKLRINAILNFSIHFSTNEDINNFCINTALSLKMSLVIFPLTSFINMLSQNTHFFHRKKI